jgi:deoxyhypusine synthase
MGPISDFIDFHYRHYNAASLRDAAHGFREQIKAGNKMLLAMGGALSTAEIGLSLAEMIRQDKFHAVSCSANNAEEDIFNLVANQLYYRVPNYRDLTPQDEQELVDKHYNRVTDTCIPEHEAFRRIEKHIVALWKEAEAKGERYFPYEFFYKLLLSGVLEEHYADNNGKGGFLKASWLYAAAQKNIPVFLPGWEDSTLGNIFTGYCLRGELKPSTMKSGIEYMMLMAEWYRKNCGKNGVGFFQLGGGIAGDFPICVVPMLEQDMEVHVPVWSYFSQVTDTNESYGSYSGANPTEKITWGKLGIETPKFSINSDATIVAPLIFAYVLGW